MASELCPRCDGRGELVVCPACGHAAALDGFDALGADDGNLFCTRCHEEFDAAAAEGRRCPECEGSDGDDVR